MNACQIKESLWRKSVKTKEPRQRLKPSARRAHLLEIGAAAFAASPYDEVQIDKIAQTADVSRGLLYHYFPGKRDFFVAIIEQGYSEILNATLPNPELPPDQQLRSALEAYVNYVAQRPQLYKAIFRSAASAEQSIQNIVDQNLDLQAQRILDRLDVDETAHTFTRLAVRSWLAFLIHAVLDWLDQGKTIKQSQLIDMCIGALEGAVKSAENLSELKTQA